MVAFYLIMIRLLSVFILLFISAMYFYVKNVFTKTCMLHDCFLAHLSRRLTL